MHLAYYDEAGDDGYPSQSSPLFGLTACYFHYLKWKDNFQELRALRVRMRDACGLPVAMEMHARPFLLNKNPYRGLGIADRDRVAAIDMLCTTAALLPLRVVNVVVVKPRIRTNDYNVLDACLKYSIQRIENDLDPVKNPQNEYMIITDPGRIGKMRWTTRKIQRINYIPSQFGGGPYRREIQGLIEDPLPKDSKESYFIQLADTISHIVYLYAGSKTGLAAFPNRIPSEVTASRIIQWMEYLKPILNTEASRTDDYGVVMTPSQ